MRILCLSLLVTAIAVSSQAATFTVTTQEDTGDAAPGDGICADASGDCSLRAAIGETDALPGADVILLPAGIYVLDRGRGFWIDDDLELIGTGAESTIIDAGRDTAPYNTGACFKTANGDVDCAAEVARRPPK